MARPGLIIFDCDGVLVDSEHIDARIRSECFQAAGFLVTTEELLANSGTSRADLFPKGSWRRRAPKSSVCSRRSYGQSTA